LKSSAKRLCHTASCCLEGLSVRSRTSLEMQTLSRASHDADISCAIKQATLGTYRVRLENIKIPDIAADRVTNVRRLKRVFKVQGCLRNDPQNYITAIISEEVFRRRTRDNARESTTVVPPPKLLLASEEEVACIHGKCTIKAASQILHGRDRWWVVRLYPTGLGESNVSQSSLLLTLIKTSESVANCRMRSLMK